MSYPDLIYGLDRAGGKKLIAPAVVQTSHANPAGTAAGPVMCGLGDTWTITPQYTGRVFVWIEVTGNNTIAGNGGNLTIQFGTGAAPVNGAALSGTTAGPNIRGTAGAQGFEMTMFAVLGFFTPFLSIGVAVWIDLAQAATGGGTFSITNPFIMAYEV